MMCADICRYLGCQVIVIKPLRLHIKMYSLLTWWWLNTAILLPWALASLA